MTSPPSSQDSPRSGRRGALTPRATAPARDKSRPTFAKVWTGKALAVHLLERLLALSQSPAELPIKSHSERLASGARGVSLAFLQGMRDFFEARGALGMGMEDVCNSGTCDFTVCALTAHTGLSLAESVVYVAELHGIAGVEELVGVSTTFLSYSWTGTLLGDMLWAVQRQVDGLEARSSGARYVWIDMLCASQNLLSGRYLPTDATELRSLKEGNPEEYRRRKEDTDNIFDDAINSVEELLFYFSPLDEEWLAPKHAFLLEDHAPAPAGWMREGPAALTRAWCTFELAKALQRKCKLYVVLRSADVAVFGKLMGERGGYRALARLIARIDVKDAQITKVDDRAYIMSQVNKGRVNTHKQPRDGGYSRMAHRGGERSRQPYCRSDRARALARQLQPRSLDA